MSTKSRPIRIVPIHRPEAAAQPQPSRPKLTYRGGPLIPAVEVFTVFWGDAWKQQAQANLVPKLNQFFDVILSSDLMDQLAEYSVSGTTIGHGRRTGSTQVPGGATDVTDEMVRKMLQDSIAATSGGFPQPSPNTLYFVYLPPGVTSELAGSQSCQAYCGYHDEISGQVIYAVMPYPDCAGCLGGAAAFDALTSTSSHELCEAITDPVPGQGWYDDANGEIGDICAWSTRQVAGYTVQLEWSNRARSCV